MIVIAVVVKVPATGKIMTGVAQAAIQVLETGTNGVLKAGEIRVGAAVKMEHHSINSLAQVIGAEYFLADSTAIRP